MKREKLLDRVRNQSAWDVVVIGGGATGLGVAVDAATRGLGVLLLEARDFAHGTSSRSTKLVHGGVRYLEQGDVPLVLEALRERGRLHQNAPHLVQHQSFIVPRYQWWEGPFFGLGLKLYDALAGRLNLARSRMVSREETIERIPNIETRHLLGGVEYFDGQFDDARLAISLLRTAANHGAVLLNYAPVEELTVAGGLVGGVVFRDAESGETQTVAARVVVNATGIFCDSIRRMERAEVAPVVQPSQGVHLVFDRSFLKGHSAIMVPHTDDGRVLFVIPWHDRVLVGTTDTPMQKPDEEPRALPEEIGFILRNAARYLARAPREEDILSVFAGQRPLVRPPGRDGGPTKAISRNHEVLISEGGLVTIVGGKWTTYRQMAEDTMEQVLALGGWSDRPCVTVNLPLAGWRSPHAGLLPFPHGLYGADATELLALEQEYPDDGKPLHERLAYTLAMVRFAARKEMARTVEDVLARRTRALFLDARAAMEVAPAVARVLAEELGRDENWARAQVNDFTRLARGYLPPDLPRDAA
jgi:glycerol-3-phosphate dehydrogenase